MRFDALRRVGLRGRLVLLFFLGVIPIFASEILAIAHQRTSLRAHAEDEAGRLSRVLAAQLESTLDSTYQLLRVLENHPAVLRGGADCDAALDDMVERDGPYTGFGVGDEEGRLVCSSPRSRGFVALRPAFSERLRRTGFAVGETEVGPLSGKVVVLAAHVIRRDTGVKGYVVAGLDLEQLSAMAARIQLPARASFLIVNSDGTLLARYPHPGAGVSDHVAKAPIYPAILENPTTAGIVEAEGVDSVRRLFGYAPLEAGGTRFFVAVGLDITDFMASSTAAVTRSAGALALTAFLTLVMAVIGGEFFLRRPINSMLATTNRIARGDFAARVGLEVAPGELDALAHGIDEMAAGLQTREERVASLSRRVLDVQESERHAVARELHDGIGQALTAVKLMLQGFQQHDAARRTNDWADLLEIVDDALQQVRGLSLDLRPPMLDHLGLAVTLRWYVNREAERAGLASVCEIEPEELRLDSALETTLFRIAQEALTNVARHAMATMVWVTLRESDGIVELTVRDDGCGFDVEAARQRAARGFSLGILGMQERATLAGGRFEIHALQQGTEVQASFPTTRSPHP